MPDVVRLAHAKVNLLLSVGAALPAGHAHAGFHPICSWFHAIDLADDVRIAPAKESSHQITWASDAPRPTPIDWPLEKDLGVRAHRALEAHVHRALPAAITITKRIPVGGGLGGGSSDAAAVLLALREAFALDVSDADLTTLAATLGSDVAFFLDPAREPAPALVEELGTVTTRTGSLAGQELALIVPPFGCATPAVYKAFDARFEQEMIDATLERARRGNTGTPRSTAPRVQLVTGRIDKMLAAGRLDPGLLMNDLARPAFDVEPRLGQLVTTLSNACRSQAHVTGSGSGVLVVLDGARKDKVLERITAAITKLATSDDAGFAGTRVIVVKLVGGGKGD